MVVAGIQWSYSFNCLLCISVSNSVMIMSKTNGAFFPYDSIVPGCILGYVVKVCTD